MKRTLDMIVLGLLRAPSSGYELKTRFLEGANHFWSVDISQLYRTLHRLEDEGAVRSRTEPSPDGPERRVYTRTRAGDARLQEWLAMEPDVPSARLAYVGQLFFQGQGGDAVRFLEQLREQFRDRVHALEAVAANRHNSEFHVGLTLDLGLEVAQARLRWCEKALRKARRKERTCVAS